MEPKITKSIDWEYALKKPGSHCCISGRAFKPGDDYVSFLRYDPEEGWGRADIAPECFDQLDPRPFAYWRARVAEAEDKKVRPLDLNFLTEFFMRLQDQKDSTEHQEVGYIVTLLLVRKKVLAQVGLVTEEDTEWLEVRFAREKNGKVYRVLVPEITAEKMEIIRDDLGRIFNLGDDQSAKKNAPEDEEELDPMMAEEEECQEESSEDESSQV